MRTWRDDLVKDINRNASIANEAVDIKPTDKDDAMAQVLGILASNIAVTLGRVGLAMVEAIDILADGGWRNK